MALLSMIFYLFVGACGIVACLRGGKMIIKFINGLFDKIENKFL